MAIVSLNTIRNWFKTGLKPTQSQFWDTWDSFRHKSDKVPAGDIEGIYSMLLAKADKTVLENHLSDTNAHAVVFGTKLDKGGYAGTAQNLSDRIDLIQSPDALLQSVKPTRVGAEVTFPANMYVARIDKEIVQNPAIYSTTIGVATDNYHRTDLIELLADGTFNKKVGDESLTAAIKPDLSDSAVEVTTIDVFGSVISEPAEPFDASKLLPRGGYAGTAQDLNANLAKKQDIANQIEVSTSQNAQASWHGKTVFFIANVTITIPGTGLPTGYTFEGVTDPSCTVTWAITTPKVWTLGAPAATPEKSIFTIMQLMSNSNKIYLFGV